MKDDWLSAAQAAAVLGVSERRVRQLVSAGELDTAQIAGRTVLHADAVQRRSGRRPPNGRPLGPALAWAVIDLLSDEADPALVVPDRRLRHRALRQLAQHPSGDRWPQLLRRRATRRRYWAHPAVRFELVKDQRVSPGGSRAAAAHGLGIGPGDETVAYVAEADLAALEHNYMLQPDPDGEVDLHVYSEPVGIRPGEPVPVAAAVLDMLDGNDARQRHLARAWLDRALIDRPKASAR